MERTGKTQRLYHNLYLSGVIVRQSSSQKYSLRASGGFSLIEIVVASAIASLIMIMIYTAYSSTLSSIKDMTGYAELYENINLAITKMDRDLTNTYTNRNKKNVSFVCDLDGENSTLNFVTISYQDFRILGKLKTPYPASDVHEVGYYLKEDAEFPGLFFLVKREQRHYDDVPDSGGQENIILENVIGLNFQFRVGNDWDDTWDSRETQRFPNLIKTTLKIKRYGVSIHDLDNIEEFTFLSEVHVNR